MLTRNDASSTQPETPALFDRRPRWRRVAAPVVAGVGVIAATLFIRTVDPHVPGVYPPCPTKALFGIDCPGCGGLRATNCLANGDIAGALDHNMLFVVMVPFLILGWGLWMYRAWTGRQPAPTRARTLVASVLPIVLLVVASAFAIVRNFVPYLGSGVG